MKNEVRRQLIEMALSWGRVFIAASLAQYAAGITDISLMVNAGLAALIPVILRWLDPMDPIYGRSDK